MDNKATGHFSPFLLKLCIFSFCWVLLLRREHMLNKWIKLIGIKSFFKFFIYSSVIQHILISFPSLYSSQYPTLHPAAPDPFLLFAYRKESRFPRDVEIYIKMHRVAVGYLNLHLHMILDIVVIALEKIVFWVRTHDINSHHSRTKN